MPEPINPNPANPQGGATPGQGIPQSPQAPVSKFAELKQKKGFQSEEDLAKAYEEVEKGKSRFESIHGKTKQQLESQGFTIDDNGDIKPIQGGQLPYQQPPVNQPYGQPPYQQPPQEIVYDPYTGQQITDPIALQLARMPVGHREAFVFNAMLETREKQTNDSYKAEAEVLSSADAKGHEEDVKAVMRTLPLARRANKEEWQTALKIVKGTKYDEMVKRAQEQGINQFINKEANQLPAGVGGGGGGAQLTPDQEQTYQYYVKNRPGMFKDRAHFLKASTPNYGG